MSAEHKGKEIKFQDLFPYQKAEKIISERLPSPDKVIYAPTVEFLDPERKLTREERGRVVAMGDRTALSYKTLSEQVVADRNKPPVQMEGETLDATANFYLLYALSARSSNEISHTSILEQMNVGPEALGGDPPIIMEGISILSGLRDICSLRHFGFEAFSSRGGIFPEGYWRAPQGLEQAGVKREIEAVNKEIYQVYLDLTKKGLEHFVQVTPRGENEPLWRWKWKVLSLSLDEARGVTNGTFLNHLAMHPNSALSLREGIVALSSSELPETRGLADKLRELSKESLPTLMKHTDASPFTASLPGKRRAIIERFGIPPFVSKRGQEGVSELLDLKVTPGGAERVFLAAFLSEDRAAGQEAIDKVMGLSDEEVKSALDEIFEGMTLHDKPPKALEDIQVYAKIIWPLGAFYEAMRHRPATHILSEISIDRGRFVPEIYKKLGLTKEYNYALDLNERLYTMVEGMSSGFRVFLPAFVSRSHLIYHEMRISAYDIFHFFKVRASSSAHPTISVPAHGMVEESQRQNLLFKHLILKK